MFFLSFDLIAQIKQQSSPAAKSSKPLLTSFQVAGRGLVDFHNHPKHHLGLQRVTNSSKKGDSNKSKDGGAYIGPLNTEEQEYQQPSNSQAEERPHIHLPPIV